MVGGSLGARTLNESLEAGLRKLLDAGLQVIWQTGKYFGTRGHRPPKVFKGPLSLNSSRIWELPMGLLIWLCRVPVAGSISELQILGKPCVLVPSPNVAEDHQTKNALALVHKDAAVMVTDAAAREKLVNTVLELASDKRKAENR